MIFRLPRFWRCSHGFRRTAARPNDATAIAIFRRALDEVLADRRFFDRRTCSAIEIAEHILVRVASGERDIDHLKALAFKKLEGMSGPLPAPGSDREEASHG